LSCDRDAPQVGNARSDSTRVVKVNRLKTNRRKTRPYSISVDSSRITERNTKIFEVNERADQ